MTVELSWLACQPVIEPPARRIPCRDHAEERVLRHLDTCEYQTFVHVRIPRVDVRVVAKRDGWTAAHVSRETACRGRYQR